MKKTKRMLAALMSAVMLGTFSVVPNMVYAGTDTSVPFSVTIDNPDMTEGYFAVIFKNDYSKETIENTIIPELKSNDKIKDIRYYKTYYNADNFYTTDTSVYEAEYIHRDVYIVELASDDKETTYAVETAFSETEYFHYIDAVNFFKASAAQIPPDDESEPFTAKLEDNFIANKLVVMFKGKYSKEELESTVIPELKEINGIRDFSYMSTGEKGRAMYIIDLDFEREDKASAYNTAKALYDTGYFYCVEMNMIPIMDSVAVNGDANCDGELSMADAVIIMQSLANPERFGVNGTDEHHITEQGKKNADITGDNDGITNADALAIQMKLLGLDNTVDAEYEKTIDWYYDTMNDLVSKYWEIINTSNGHSAVIKNKDELRTYLEVICKEKLVSHYLEIYDNSFFENNVLLMNSIYQPYSSAGSIYEIKDIDFSNEAIDISVKTLTNGGNDMISLSIAQVIVPKDKYTGQPVNWTKN